MAKASSSSAMVEQHGDCTGRTSGDLLERASSVEERGGGRGGQLHIEKASSARATAEEQGGDAGQERGVVVESASSLAAMFEESGRGGGRGSGMEEVSSSSALAVDSYEGKARGFSKEKAASSSALVEGSGGGRERGLLKLALEAHPLREAQIPPCRIRSVAIVNGEQDDRLLIYLGTDSGQLLLFTWYPSSSSSSSSSVNPPPPPTPLPVEFSTQQNLPPLFLPPSQALASAASPSATPPSYSTRPTSGSSLHAPAARRTFFGAAPGNAPLPSSASLPASSDDFSFHIPLTDSYALQQSNSLMSHDSYSSGDAGFSSTSSPDIPASASMYFPQKSQAFKMASPSPRTPSGNTSVLSMRSSMPTSPPPAFSSVSHGILSSGLSETRGTASQHAFSPSSSSLPAQNLRPPSPFRTLAEPDQMSSLSHQTNSTTLAFRSAQFPSFTDPQVNMLHNSSAPRHNPPSLSAPPQMSNRASHGTSSKRLFPPSEPVSDNLSCPSPTSVSSSEVQLGESESDLEGRLPSEDFHSTVSAPCPSSPSHLDPFISRVRVGHSKRKLALTACQTLGKSPIEVLCPLPAGGCIAALSEQQIVLLDLHLLSSVEWLPSTKGASALARALGFTESFQSHVGTLYSPSSGTSLELSKRSMGQGHLGRLFGAGKVSGKQGRWSSLMGDFGGAISSSRGSGESYRMVRSLSGQIPGMGSAGMKTGVKMDIQGSATGLKDTRAFTGINEASSKGIERFAVAAGKKLMLYEVRPGREKRKEGHLLRERHLNVAGEFLGLSTTVKVKDFPVVEGVVTLAWLGSIIITGNSQEYLLFSVSDGQACPLFSLPQDLLRPPLLKPFPKELEVLLLIDNVGIIVNTTGQPTSGSLLFRDIPEAVGHSTPYIVAVSKGVVGVYHQKTGSRMQSITLSGTGTGPHIIADDDDGKYVVVSDASTVYCLERVHLDEQLRELLRHKQFDEATELAEEAVAERGEEHAKEMLWLVHAQAGFLLFFDLQFEAAVDHFLQSAVMQPSEIFPFFPHLTHRWRALVPWNRYWGLHPPPQSLKRVIESKLQAIQRGIMLEAADNTNSKRDGQNLLRDSVRSRSIIMEDYRLQAIEQVIRYLKVSRNKPLTPLLKDGVDTLLMKLYIEVGATMEMEQLAASSNSCLVEEVEDLLRGSAQLRTLAFLYESKGTQTLALQVWQALAYGGLTLPMLETVADKSSVENSLKPRAEASAFHHAAASEAARLLKASSDSKLVLQHLEWILKVSQDLALQVLCSMERCEALPPEDVLAVLDPDETHIHQRYLQWLIQEQGSEDARYHTLFALSLAKTAMECVKSMDSRVQGAKKFAATNDSSRIDSSSNVMIQRKTKLCNGYSTSNMTEQEYLRVQGFEEGEVSACVDAEHSYIGQYRNNQSIRNRLQEFLDSSKIYDAAAVLDLIHDSELWHEQAILYRKLGVEASVFRILALKLQDTAAAEQYCAELGRPDAYMRLLNMYLKPGEGLEPMYSAAVYLLQCHGASLDPLQVLEALSSDMPLELAAQSIAQMLRARVHRHREGQIVRHLSRAEDFEARIARLEERSRHICITDRSICGSCFARLGTKFFALYPNDSVVCYKCFRRFGEHIDPVTGHDFEKDPVFKPSHWLRESSS